MLIYSTLLIFTALAWGLGFIETKRLFAHFTPLEITFLRFTLAALFSMPVFFRRRTWRMSSEQLKRALWLAILLFLGMYLQAVGLLYTSASKSGFITSLYIVFVPLIELFFFRKKIGTIFWPALSIALVGVVLISGVTIGGSFDGVNIGDLLTLLSAFIFSFQILYLSHVASSFQDSMELNGLQCLFISLFTFLIILLNGPLPKMDVLFHVTDHFFSSPLYSLLFLGFFPSFLALAVQVSCQKRVSAHLASLAYLLESPFAALFGVLILGERLNHFEWAGCGLIGAAVLFVPFIMKPLDHS